MNSNYKSIVKSVASVIIVWMLMCFVLFYFILQVVPNNSHLFMPHTRPTCLATETALFEFLKTASADQSCKWSPTSKWHCLRVWFRCGVLQGKPAPQHSYRCQLDTCHLPAHFAQTNRACSFGSSASLQKQPIPSRTASEPRRKCLIMTQKTQRRKKKRRKKSWREHLAPKVPEYRLNGICFRLW